MSTNDSFHLTAEDARILRQMAAQYPELPNSQLETMGVAGDLATTFGRSLVAALDELQSATSIRIQVCDESNPARPTNAAEVANGDLLISSDLLSTLRNLNKLVLVVYEPTELYLRTGYEIDEIETMLQKLY